MNKMRMGKLATIFLAFTSCFFIFDSQLGASCLPSPCHAKEIEILSCSKFHKNSKTVAQKMLYWSEVGIKADYLSKMIQETSGSLISAKTLGSRDVSCSEARKALSPWHSYQNLMPPQEYFSEKSCKAFPSGKKIVVIDVDPCCDTGPSSISCLGFEQLQEAPDSLKDGLLQAN